MEGLLIKDVLIVLRVQVFEASPFFYSNPRNADAYHLFVLEFYQRSECLTFIYSWHWTIYSQNTSLRNLLVVVYITRIYRLSIYLHKRVISLIEKS